MIDANRFNVPAISSCHPGTRRRFAATPNRRVGSIGQTRTTIAKEKGITDVKPMKNTTEEFSLPRARHVKTN